MSNLIKEVRKEKEEGKRKFVKSKIRNIVDKIERLKSKERKLKSKLDKVKETWINLEGLVGDLEDNYEINELYRKIQDGKIGQLPQDKSRSM